MSGPINFWVSTSKVIGEMGQNLVWNSFSIDTLHVPNYKEIGRGQINPSATQVFSDYY